MQKAIYVLALLLPVIFGQVVRHTGFVDWLWYSGREQAYYTMATLKMSENFNIFLGGYPLLVFVGLVLFYWFTTDDTETIPKQFLLLPLAFVPISILGTALAQFSFDVSMLYIHPLLIIPLGYLYIIPWAVLVWLLKKINVIV